MKTTIAVSRGTKQQLQMMGTKGQTYDAIISELVEVAEKSDFFERQKTILATERFVRLNEI
tara:strand:+ start:729 stop:911 length:183 start_codon:yes stop_codon:yes gene_type:complete